ncbi:MAG TPA: hypothetical protein VKZ65_11720, partial [Glycomyces sp.]|nr:hypothetical protein [Glycomyces sp.]
MSHGGELFALADGAVTEPSFDTEFKGYNRKRVDRYVAQVEAEIAALAAEREQAYAQIQALAGQVEQLQLELTELRRRGPVVEKAAFAHLGPMVGQILALAEEQAEAIKLAAVHEIDERRAEA